MAGNLPPQLPAPYVFLHSFGGSDVKQATPNAYRQAVTFGDQGVNIPNSVCTVSGQMTFTDLTPITTSNNKFTIKCMPLVADTPVLNIQQINLETTNVQAPPATSSSGVWNCDIPPQSSKQDPLVWIPTGTFTYIGADTGGIIEPNAAIDANILSYLTAMPSVENTFFNGLPSGPPREFISNPFGLGARAKNFNSVNTVVCVPAANTVRHVYNPAGNPNVPVFVNADTVSLVNVNLGPIVGFIPAVPNTGQGQAPSDERQAILRNYSSYQYIPIAADAPLISWNQAGSGYNPALATFQINQSMSLAPIQDVICPSSLWNGFLGTPYDGTYGTPGPCVQSATIGGFPQSSTFTELMTDSTPKTYGQNFFNTFAWTGSYDAAAINPTATGFFTPLDFPFAGMHPFDFLGHNGNFTYDHQISFVTSLTFLMNRKLAEEDNLNQGYHVFSINNSEHSAFHSHFTNPAQSYEIKIGHCWLPFINRSGNNLFHPGWPIPCHQVLNAAPQPSAASLGNRLQSDFTTFLGYNADPQFGDCYNWSYNSANRTELATGANIKFGTCDFPKNRTFLPGYEPTFYNFPNTAWPIVGFGANNVFINQVYNPEVSLTAFVQPVNGGMVVNVENNGFQYSNNWLTAFPEGVCSDGAFVYTGRMAVLMKETLSSSGEHTGNYTTPEIWTFTFEIPVGMYSANSLLYALNKALNTPIENSQDFPLYRYVNMRDNNYLCVATDYVDDDLLAWSGTNNPCQGPANRQGPSSIGCAGRIISAKKGPNTFVQLGARNFQFAINADGKLAFTGTYTVNSPDVLGTSTLADGVPSVYYLPTSYSRSGIDPPLWGDLGQIDLLASTLTQLVIDPVCWASSPAVRMINVVEASSDNAADQLSRGFVGGDNLNVVVNSSNQAVSVQYLPNLQYAETRSLATDVLIQQGSKTFPALQNYLGNIWPSIAIIDLATHAKYSIQNGIYFNPCSSAFLPGSTGIQILSLCDGSATEMNFWGQLGFDASLLINFWTPKFENVLPVEGRYYNPNTQQYGFDPQAFCISNENPQLFRQLPLWYAQSAVGFPTSGNSSQQAAWINASFLPTLPTYDFYIPYYVSKNATADVSNPEGAISAVNTYGWTNGILNRTVKYSTNCPLFCTVFTGLPDYLLEGEATIDPWEQISTKDFQLQAYVGEAGALGCCLNGMQKFIGIIDGKGSGDSLNSPYEIVYVLMPPGDEGINALISVTDLVGMNPYNLHQAVPRPLNAGIFGCTYDPNVVDVAAGKCLWPMNVDVGGNLWRPNYTGFLPVSYLNNLSQVGASYEPVCGSMACWPPPLSGRDADNYILQYTAGMPLLSMVGKTGLRQCPVTTQAFDVGAWSFTHTTLMKLLDQLQVYCPQYAYDANNPLSPPSITGLQYYMQGATDALASYGPRPDATNVPPAPGSWVDCMVLYIQGNNSTAGATAYGGSPFWMTNGSNATPALTPLNSYLSLQDGLGWQVPIAGRIRCDQIAPYYLNSTPLQYERGTAGLQSSMDISSNYAASYPDYVGNATHYTCNSVTDTYTCMTQGGESRMISYCTNLSILDSKSLGYIYNSSTTAISGGSFANPLTAQTNLANCNPPSIPTSGSGNTDPSDPIQITSLFTQNYIAYGQFQVGNLNEDGMFLLSIRGTPNFELAMATWIDGFRARNYIPVAVQSSSGLTNTISFNTSVPFDTAAQIIDQLNFEFYDVTLQPLRNIVNIRLLLTFTPTGQPTPEELAFITGASPAQIASQVPSQVNYAGPNSLLAQPPTPFNAAGIKRPSGPQAFTTPARPANYPKFTPSAKSV